MIRRQQVSGQTAIKLLEQLWNRDLSAYDPDGPLPDDRPGPRREHRRPRAGPACGCTATRSPPPREWRALAEAKNLSIRELIIEVTGRQTFIGSPATVAEAHQRLRPGRRQRRLHPRPAHHPGRPRRVRRQGRAAAAGAGRVPHRVRGRHPARPPRARAPAAPGDRDPEPRRGACRRMTSERLTVATTMAAPRSPSSTSCRSPPARPPARRCATASTWPSRPRSSATPGYWFAEHHLNPGVAGTSPAVVLALDRRRHLHHPARLRRRPARAPHRAVHRRGVRAARRRCTPAGSTSASAAPAGATEPRAAGRARAGGAATVVDGHTPNGLLIPPPFSLARACSTRRASPCRSSCSSSRAPSRRTTPSRSTTSSRCCAGTYRSADGIEAHVVPGEGADVQVWILGSSGGRAPQVAGAQRPALRRELPRQPGHRARGGRGLPGRVPAVRELDRPYVSVSADVVVARRRRHRARAGRPATACGCAASAAARARSRSPPRTRPARTPGPTTDRAWSPTASRPSSSARRGRSPTSSKSCATPPAPTSCVITTITHDHADRVRSYELLAEEWVRRTDGVSGCALLLGRRVHAQLREQPLAQRGVRGAAVRARRGQLHGDVRADPPPREHHHPVREHDRLVDVVRHEQHRRTVPAHSRRSSRASACGSARPARRTARRPAAARVRAPATGPAPRAAARRRTARGPGAAPPASRPRPAPPGRARGRPAPAGRARRCPAPASTAAAAASWNTTDPLPGDAESAAAGRRRGRARRARAAACSCPSRCAPSSATNSPAAMSRSTPSSTSVRRSSRRGSGSARRGAASACQPASVRARTQASVRGPHQRVRAEAEQPVDDQADDDDVGLRVSPRQRHHVADAAGGVDLLDHHQREPRSRSRRTAGPAGTRAARRAARPGG